MRRGLRIGNGINLGWFTDLSMGAGGAPAVPWYLTGGIAAAHCIAAYKPIGAANLAASYTNLANPGTYDAAPGVAPTWDATNGWIFDGSTQYLNSGVLPANNQQWSAIVRYTGVSLGPGKWLIGSYAGTRYFGIQPYDDQASHGVVYLNGSFVRVVPYLENGILAVSGNQGYRNGISDGSAIGAGEAGVLDEVYIGAANAADSPINFRQCNIQALAFYDIPIAAYITALNAAVAALP